LCLDDATEEQTEEFLREIEQMKLLGAHQNIVSLVGCCTLQEHKFLVIEYVPFGDLLQWLRRKRRLVRCFPKESLKNLMFDRLMSLTNHKGVGSNGFYGKSVLKDGESELTIHFKNDSPEPLSSSLTV